jgi:AbrB family looped-hinge helix DNA binding protein
MDPKNMKVTFFGSNTMGEKGQVVIPVEGRQAMGINPGDKLIFLGDPAKNVLIVAKPEIIEERIEEMQSHFQSVREQISEQIGGGPDKSDQADK